MSEQKIWVEKIPKNCWECPCFRDDIDFPCGLSDGIQDYFKDEIDGGKCPLLSIKAHDRELIRQVCEKIRKSSYDILYEEGQFDISDMECVVEDIKNEFRFSWVYKKDTK